MNRECDHLRLNALSQGENSEAYAEWVRHSHHCADCQAELFIMETLREDAEVERMHLSRESLARLTLIAQAQYGHRRKRHFMRQGWSIFCRVAAVVALAVILLQLIPRKWGYTPLQHGNEQVTESIKELSRVAESEFVDASQRALEHYLESSQPEEASVGQLDRSALAGALPDVSDFLPGQAFGRRIRQAALRIRLQRLQLDELIDHDLRGY